jgi:type IV pilus assembly protein PilV
MMRAHSSTQPAQLTRGFSLVEVLVALAVTSIGLLGVAKIQALSLSSTGTARMRSMAAFAAASLAAAMRADRAYWANITADPAVSIDVSKESIASADPVLTTPPASACTISSPCQGTEQIAAQDLHDWASNLHSTLAGSSNPTANVSCRISATNPVTCAIRIVWTEHVVSTPYSTNTLSTAQQAIEAAAQTGRTSYTLYTQP